MSPAEFVGAIRKYVRDAAIAVVRTSLQSPPGRRPDPQSVTRSAWYCGLSEHDRKMVDRVVELSVDAAIFGFLAVLDGVRAIEPPGSKGVLRLLHVVGNSEIQLNDPAAADLHDLFKSVT